MGYRLRSFLAFGLLFVSFLFNNNVTGEDVGILDDDKIKNDDGILDVDKLKNATEKLPLGECATFLLKSIPCDAQSRYRTYDGSCNNLAFPFWGSVQECVKRFLPVYYEGTHGIRKAVSGRPLPEVRDLSLNLCSGVVRPATDTSFLFPIFGQMVGHDISLSAPDLDDVEAQKCCPPSKDMDDNCYPILIRPDDPFYSKYSYTCIPNLRTPPCTCSPVIKRHQANRVTSALDLSVVYDVSEEKAKKLRRNDGTGRLLSELTRAGELLPRYSDMACPVMKRNSCFATGDIRANQHAPLMSMQTLFMREHNRIVGILHQLNPKWDEETLFQEGRRILGATYQAIVFKELLPHLAGPHMDDGYRLRIKQGGAGTIYEPGARLGAWAEFSTVTMRLHSLVNSPTGLRNVDFKDLYCNADLIRRGNMKPLLVGLRRTPSQQYGHDQVLDIRGFFNASSRGDHGLDLSSIDIARGRDHGIAPYPRFVEYSFSSKKIITTFDDLASVMSQDHIQLLKNNYENVNDVDAWIGVQMERHLPGASVGPSAAWINAQQFYYVKYSDRFYFEHENLNTSFTKAQRKTLQESTLSRIICDNTKIKAMQSNALLLPGPNNTMMQCDSIPQLDLSLWKV